jgi:hypothetical protein
MKVVPVLHELSTIYEGVWGSRYIDPRFIDLGTSWRCGQLHAPAALPPGKDPPVPNG